MNITQIPANSIKGNLSNQTAGRKRKGKNIFNVPYGQPANNIIADEIDVHKLLRSGHQGLLSKLTARAREQRKLIREIVTEINSSSDQHSDQNSDSIDPFTRAVDKLSDPAFECTLPFPFVGSEAPVRFKLDKEG
jgi:hypothetical protein